MFLDDQIVEMVLEARPKTYEAEIDLLNRIISLCMARVSKNLNARMENDDILPATKQVCNLFDSAARTLEKKGLPFLQVGGFRTYLLSKPDLAEVLIPLGL